MAYRLFKISRSLTRTLHNMAEHVIVGTQNGQVRGKILESIREGRYVSFQGIPYGKPPVGDLRFKPAQPAESWNGVRDALHEGPSCPSVHLILQQYVPNSSEDCLYLNVYTPSVPKTSSDRRLPVMFWIHGGGFSKGSGDTDVYGPDYLITEDVVVVTCNYRLGALGFLNLQIPGCTGNNGLKDIVLALKWVQQNIANFGGDPSNVTIFGESAGGAAVSYLLLSPLSKGLFHKAISQSGSALNPWAFSRNPRKFAFRLGDVLGCKTTDDKELLKFLKNASPKDMVLMTDSIQKKVDSEGGGMTLAFVPSVEPEGTEGAFITKTPAELIRTGQFHDVPYITGVVTLEGLIILTAQGNRDLVREKDYYKCVPTDLNLQYDSEITRNVIAKVRDHYFKNGYNRNAYVDLLSRIHFINGIQKTIEGRLNSTNKSPTYSYQFSYDGEKRLLKSLLGYDDFKGTAHSDELGYLFQINALEATLTKGTKDYEIVRIITKLWTDFAKTGNPTPELKDGINVKWEPVTRSQDNYLEIGETLQLKKNLEERDTQFWNGVYSYVNNVLKGKL